jgi:DNA mismatch repair protein MutS
VTEPQPAPDQLESPPTPETQPTAAFQESQSMAAAPVPSIPAAASSEPSPDQTESPPTEAQPSQLSLFGDLPPKSAKASKNKGDAVIQTLLSANLLNMTPLEAMNFLFALQQKARQ